MIALLLSSFKKYLFPIIAILFILGITYMLWHSYETTKADNIILKNNIAVLNQSILDLQEQSIKQNQLNEQALIAIRETTQYTNQATTKLTDDISLIKEAAHADDTSTSCKTPLPSSLSTALKQLRR